MKNSTERFHQRIMDTLENLPQIEKERFTMKKFFVKKYAVITACLIIAVGASAFAGTSAIIKNRYSSSSSKAKYSSVPTEETVKKDIGYDVPSVPETFENGYGFSGGVPVDLKDCDENGNTVNDFKGLMYKYKKDSDEISVHIEKAISDEIEFADNVKSYNDTDIYYSSYKNKFVPGDYEQTEQDKKDEADGKYVFSYGSDKIEIKTVQNIHFYKDSCLISICAIDSALDKDALVDMASEIIDLNSK